WRRDRRDEGLSRAAALVVREKALRAKSRALAGVRQPRGALAQHGRDGAGRHAASDAARHHRSMRGSAAGGELGQARASAWRGGRTASPFLGRCRLHARGPGRPCARPPVDRRCDAGRGRGHPLHARLLREGRHAAAGTGRRRPCGPWGPCGGLLPRGWRRCYRAGHRCRAGRGLSRRRGELGRRGRVRCHPDRPAEGAAGGRLGAGVRCRGMPRGCPPSWSSARHRGACRAGPGGHLRGTRRVGPGGHHRGARRAGPGGHHRGARRAGPGGRHRGTRRA
ncbi:unnamed protein product, partial [Prorocentrum cordatum]